jgi:uncharacterized protein YidB (DUF937 family)
MGLLDSVSNLIARFQGGGGAPSLDGALEKAGFGGLDGVISALQQGGLGAEVQSWLGSGANLPITADQLRAALSNEQVQQIAEHFGIPADAALNLLAEHLPSTVDQARPGGTVQPKS